MRGTPEYLIEYLAGRSCISASTLTLKRSFTLSLYSLSLSLTLTPTPSLSQEGGDGAEEVARLEELLATASLPIRIQQNLLHNSKK